MHVGYNKGSFKCLFNFYLGFTFPCFLLCFLTNLQVANEEFATFISKKT